MQKATVIIDVEKEVNEKYTANLSKDDQAIIDRWKSENLIEIVNITDEQRKVFYD